MIKRTMFQQMSAEVAAAADTGNLAELLELDRKVSEHLADGYINLPQAGELTLDIETATDALSRNDYLDEGYAAIAQGL